MNNTSPESAPEEPCASDKRLAVYEAPAVNLEIPLEVRAGTPDGMPDLLDLVETK